MVLYYFKEIDLKTSIHNSLHVITMPDHNEKNGYRQEVSLNAFLYHPRKNATKKDKDNYQTNGCYKNNEILYYGMTELRYEEGIKLWNLTKKEYPDLLRNFVLIHELQRIEHRDLWHFYGYIGYDWKNKHYVKQKPLQKYKDENFNKKIKRNKLQCNVCHVIIESKHVHDFLWCRCGNIAADGGREYLKRVGGIQPYTDLSEFE